jgi:K+-transporting ATPase ATPase A chain
VGAHASGALPIGDPNLDMNGLTALEYAVFLLIVVALVRPVGTYLALVFTGGRTLLDHALRPVERAIYRLTRVDPDHEMDWRECALSFVLFGAVGTAVLFLIPVMQPLAPWNNHADLSTTITPDLAFNTAVSFITTTT